MIYYRYVICRGNRVKMINVPYGNSVIRYIANYDKMFRCRLQILKKLLADEGGKQVGPSRPSKSHTTPFDFSFFINHSSINQPLS